MLLVLLCILNSGCADPIAFFVSPDGSDAAQGTSAGTAFATLQRAQAALRQALNASAQSADAVVTVLPGTYISRDPLVFSPEDSGTNGFKVVWSCAGAILYVGVALTEWYPSPLGPNVFVTNVTPLAPPPAPRAPFPPWLRAGGARLQLRWL